MLEESSCDQNANENGFTLPDRLPLLKSHLKQLMKHLTADMVSYVAKVRNLKRISFSNLK